MTALLESSPFVLAAARLALLVAPAALLAWTLRHARVPGRAAGAAALGGAVAGILVGPSVLGRAAPDLHDVLLRGGVAEERALARTEALTSARRDAHALEMTELAKTGVSGVAGEEHAVALAAELAARDDRRSAEMAALSAAREATRHDVRALIWLLALVAVLCAPCAALGRARRDDTPALALAVLLGAGTAALAAAVFFDLGPVGSAGVGLAAALPGIRHVLPRVHPPRGLRGAARWIVAALVLPATAAALVCTIDLHAPAAGTGGLLAWIGAMVFAVVVSSDVRWVSGYAAARALPLAGAGPWSRASRWTRGAAETQLVVAACVFGVPGRDDTRFAVGLLVGALFVNLTTRIRHRLARALDGNADAPDADRL